MTNKIYLNSFVFSLFFHRDTSCVVSIFDFSFFFFYFQLDFFGRRYFYFEYIMEWTQITKHQMQNISIYLRFSFLFTCVCVFPKQQQPTERKNREIYHTDLGCFVFDTNTNEHQSNFLNFCFSVWTFTLDFLLQNTITEFLHTK